MESSRDQCAKEGCRGCESCGGRYSDSYIVKPSPDLKAYSKALKSWSDEDLQAELKRRKEAAKTEETRQAKLKAHNEPILREIKALKEQLTRLESKLRS